MIKNPKCQFCKEPTAEYALQFLNEGYKPTFYLLGEHVRGFKLWKICDSCKEKYLKLDGLALKDEFDILHAGRLYPLG